MGGRLAGSENSENTHYLHISSINLWAASTPKKTNTGTRSGQKNKPSKFKCLAGGFSLLETLQPCKL